MYVILVDKYSLNSIIEHMESLPLGNFFEVTINSNKLFALINEMMGTLKDQAKHISAL